MNLALVRVVKYSSHCDLNYGIRIFKYAAKDHLSGKVKNWHDLGKSKFKIWQIIWSLEMREVKIFLKTSNFRNKDPQHSQIVFSSDFLPGRNLFTLKIKSEYQKWVDDICPNENFPNSLKVAFKNANC